MRWKKLGHVYAPDGSKSWAVSHAANPVAEPRGGDHFRIYFSCRDTLNRSSIGWVEIDLKDPLHVLAESEEPVLGPGDLGMFDDCGVSIGCILPVGRKRFLYYMGWNLSVTVPWKNALGLAISEGPGEPFVRHSRFPVVPLDEVDPYTISYPWVLEEDGRFRMWYGSNIRWGTKPADMLHLLKYADSSDGITWNRQNTVVVDFKNSQEYAICKPCVVRDPDCYRMWFCARGDVDRETYRIDYAESPDGLHWERQDGKSQIDISAEGWDSQMIEYPSVFDHQGRRYLLYSGNGYGSTGFGIAVMEDDSR